MSTIDQLRQHIIQIRQIAARHGATNLRVFGSIARGEDDKSSDLDLLVDTLPQTSAWFPAGLVLELEALLGRKIDVVTTKGLHPLIRDRVLREALVL